MQALITGANGFLGSHLARRLVERDDRVTRLPAQEQGVKAYTVYLPPRGVAVAMGARA